MLIQQLILSSYSGHFMALYQDNRVLHINLSEDLVNKTVKLFYLSYFSEYFASDEQIVNNSVFSIATCSFALYNDSQMVKKCQNAKRFFLKHGNNTYNIKIIENTKLFNVNSIFANEKSVKVVLKGEIQSTSSQIYLSCVNQFNEVLLGLTNTTKLGYNEIEFGFSCEAFADTYRSLLHQTSLKKIEKEMNDAIPRLIASMCNRNLKLGVKQCRMMISQDGIESQTGYVTINQTNQKSDIV